jgi:hypothetical protein
MPQSATSFTKIELTRRVLTAALRFVIAARVPRALFLPHLSRAAFYAGG